ncbi:nuclear transport factor 2 family protein [Phaeovulum sp. W22_SRMD_FR3]|uniref:nuclear transport factor 2 family protein n=1 Tax=Phaeovulum sp. W22_SRMD_FR3 TaxID=3240274 RepID=UPI003F9CC044
MNLPGAVHTYFSAQVPQDGEAFAAAFAPEAIVHDEGQQHRGPEEIRAWWLAAKAKYRHSAEPLDMAQRAGKTVVRARVSGDFPGSPAVLTFTFGLSGEKITELEIG